MNRCPGRDHSPRWTVGRGRSGAGPCTLGIRRDPLTGRSRRNRRIRPLNGNKSGGLDRGPIGSVMAAGRRVRGQLAAEPGVAVGGLPVAVEGGGEPGAQ
jgi:hypothetical protein